MLWGGCIFFNLWLSFVHVTYMPKFEIMRKRRHIDLIHDLKLVPRKKFNHNFHFWSFRLKSVIKT